MCLAIGFSIVGWAVGYVIFVGSTLLVESPMPARIDVLFTFGGHPSRIEWSRKLAERYDCIWFAGAPDTDSELEQFNSNSTIRVPTQIRASHSTYEEAIALRQSLTTMHIESQTVVIAVVSEAYHMRRIRVVLERVFRDTGDQFVYLPVPEEFDERTWRARIDKGWWRDQVLIREIMKNLYYFLHGYLLPIGRNN